MTKGFTLIELLVVVSIIGILIALSIFGLQGARESSRDARRKADLELIRSGLEIYKSDCDAYPMTLGTALVGDDPGNEGCDGNTYIASVPGDPLGSAYYYASDGTIYRVCAALEQSPTTPDSCTGCTNCNYKVVNP